MSLLQYWPVANEINACIKHEAEGVHDAVLLAVHRPSPLSYKLISSGEKFDASEGELFKYLVTEDVPSGTHVVPITGSSGVGKSHMVRILNARLQSTNEDGKYVVIRIPKSASLRRVVELILEKLPEEEYAQVRAEFAKALTEDLDIETAVIRFQRELDIALGQLAKELEARVKANPRDTVVKEQWGHAAALSKFMGDAILVDHFRSKVFPRFVQRAIAGQNQIENEALVKDFLPEDLVIPDAIDISKAATPTIAYYNRNLLSREGEGLKTATRLLNENMLADQAIRQLFSLHQSLGGMTLQEVILEIRRRLLGQSRELVIFVEDFKALTGIQDILLKVLIQEGVRDGVQELATLRSVIAVTDGYLDTADTIATRAKREWKVESELSSPDEVFSRTKALVAAYLNAARWGFENLVRHFETNKKKNKQSAWIGPYMDPDGSGDASTLAAFGYEDGIPLFPYTETAINQMARSALTRNNALVFTPRFIIDNVLRSLLLEGRTSFEQGQFPPPSIIPPPQSAEIAQWLSSLPVSFEIRERYKRVVSIWGNSTRTAHEIGYIPKEVFDAFKLDRPDIEFKATPKQEPKKPTDQEQGPTVPKSRPEDDTLRDTLQKWVEGERMPQTVANQIRNSIAIALTIRIDWTSERCEKIAVERKQISIPLSFGEGNIDANPIKIADSHEDQSGQLRSELLAVTRLHHLQSGKHTYDGADDDMVWVSNLVDRLMPQALTIHRFETQQRLVASVRLLQTNSQILGLNLRGKNIGSVAPFLFGKTSIPKYAPSGSTSAIVDWVAIQEHAQKIRPELIQSVASFSGSFQGVTGRTPYALDMERVASALQDDRVVQASNVLEFSSELKMALAAMSETRVTALARRFLQEAVTIKNKLLVEFGENFEKKEIVDELKGLADQLSGSGAWPTDEIGMGAIAFKNRCDEFHASAIRESLSVLSSCIDESGAQVDFQLLGKIGRLDANPLNVAFEFSEVASKVVRTAEKRASALESQFEGVDPKAQTDAILEQFKLLLEKLDTFSSEGETS
jgi:hypothetical protein